MTQPKLDVPTLKWLVHFLEESIDLSHRGIRLSHHNNDLEGLREIMLLEISCLSNKE